MQGQEGQNVPGGEGGGGEEVSSLQIGAIAGAAACICVLVCLMFAYIAWAVMTIFGSSAAGHVPCAEDSNIWYFCLVAVILMPLMACVLNLVSKISSSSSVGIIMQMVPSVLNLVVAVWGMLLWANMTDECMSFYDNEFGHLMLLFKINVVLLSISFVTLLCVIAAGAAALVAALSSGGTSRYENIPDSVEQTTGSSVLTEEYV